MNNKNIMKKLVVLWLGCVLTFGLTAVGEPNQADQKWLQAVQKMVAKGESKLSTPIEARVSLLKEWGAKNGYSVKAVKTETGYRIEVTRHLAQK